MRHPGLANDLGNLFLLSDAESRSISPENFTGARGGGARATEGTGARAARDLGSGWKISPSVLIPAGEIFTLADIEGPGAIQQIWLTHSGAARTLILRIFWDDQAHPSVECPIGDFFASPWEGYAQVNSLPVQFNPAKGMCCNWTMPFRRRARIEIENLAEGEEVMYYQVNYALAPVDEEAAYFHAGFRRSNPVPYGEVHTILDGVEGRGQYVGTSIGWGVNNTGWWGEGEIKFHLDGEEHPTIVGTGTEDYFGGAWNFDAEGYQPFSGPYMGLPHIVRPDGLYRSQTRFAMYRWHLPDPVRFRTGLRVTIQALGWRSGGRYLPLQDDLASTAFWYQTLPSAPLRTLPARDELEVI